MRKVALIHNPFSGMISSSHASTVQTALAVFRDAGISARAIQTRGPGSAVELARQAIAEGVDSIVAGGGDGTVNEVLQAVVGTKVALGVLPLGTANALAVNLGLLGSPANAARLVSVADKVRFSVGRIYYQDDQGVSCSRYFTVAAGIGADALFLSRMKPALKRRLGYLLYLIEGFRVWATHFFPLFEARFTNGTGETHTEQISQLLAIRVRNFGGVLRNFAPGATLQSDSLTLIAFNTRQRLHYFRFLLAVIFGRHSFSRHVHLIHADSVECRASKGSHHSIFAEADGEVLGHLPVRIDILPDAVTLLVPPSGKP